MGYYLTTLAILAVFATFALAFINMPPASIANAIRKIVPLVLIGTAVLLFYSGRGGIAVPFLFVGIALWRRNRNIQTLSTPGPGQHSTVRSAWLEMHLDHDTGDLDGIILTGPREGEKLSNLEDEVLIELYGELSEDGESAALMEAYLDRRISGWRENTHGSASAGQSSASGSGPMSKEEAYQVLGLEPGARAAQIKAAHRRLMKAVHPDSGGSTFLAARINQAKDTLLE